MNIKLVFFYGALISLMFTIGLIKYFVTIKKEQIQQIQNHVDNLQNRIRDLEIQADDLVNCLEQSDAWSWCHKYSNVKEVLSRRWSRRSDNGFALTTPLPQGAVRDNNP